MKTCTHEDFAASVGIARLTDEKGAVTGYMAVIRVTCSQCKRAFQFLGLDPGIDTRGARVSIDGLEAHIALCPQGEQPSALDRIAVNFPPPARRH